MTLNNRIERVSISRLLPHPKNSRLHEVQAIEESVKENGFYGVIVAQASTGYILAGHGRLAALKRSGETEVDVCWLDVDDDRALKILLADNRTNDLAAYNEDALKATLQGILDDGGSLYGTGFDESFLEEVAEAAKDSETLLDQAIQLRPAREYVVVMCETADEFEDLKVALDLKMVRRGGYKPGSAFDAAGVERVIEAGRVLRSIRTRTAEASRDRSDSSNRC